MLKLINNAEIRQDIPFSDTIIFLKGVKQDNTVYRLSLKFTHIVIIASV